MNDVFLVSTLHDPRGSLAETLEKSALVILENYRKWIVAATPETPVNIKKRLRELGAVIVEDKNTYGGISAKVEGNHIIALGKALEEAEREGIKKVQYTDGDRMIMAGCHFPSDVAKMAKQASEIGENLGYHNFRRSPSDFRGHHKPLRHTEWPFSRLYSEAFGLKLDVGSTSHVMSTDVVQEILKKSSDFEPITFPHPKWMIIAKEMGAKITSSEVKNVLTFETPEQFRKGVEERVGEKGMGYGELQREYLKTLGYENIHNPKEWELRFATEEQYLRLLRNNLDKLGLEGRKRELLKEEIE